MPDSDDIVERADALDKVLSQDFTAIVPALVKGLEHQKRVSRWLFTSICLDLMLTFGLGYFITQSAYQAAAIDRNSTATALAATQQRYFCVSGNKFFVQERELWNQILNLPPSPGLTALQLQARLDSNVKIRSYLDIAFQHRVCE